MLSEEKQIPLSLSKESLRQRSQTRSVTALQIATVLLSIAFFPASWVLVYYLLDHRNWCFADFCVESMGSRKIPVRNTLAVFYCFLGLTALIALASQRVHAIKRFFSKSFMLSTSVTLGEITWFVVALLVINIGVPAMIWKDYWNMWDMMAMDMDGSGDMGDGFFTAYWPWIRIVYETLILTTGDSLAINFGLVMLPVSKNSFLATYFNLPYTSMLRIHQWLGFSLFWLAVLHLLLTMLSYSMDITPLYKLFFTVIYDPPTWGDSNYLFITGMISFLILGIVIITSMTFIRRRFYNSFYFIHFLVFVSIIFAYLHASMSIYYLIPGRCFVQHYWFAIALNLTFMISGFCLYGIDVVTCLSARFALYPIRSVNYEDCGYFTVKIQINKVSNARPGQFIRIAIPDISNLEFHPFTVAESTAESVTFVFAPNRQSGSHSEWTNKLAQALQTNSQRMVCIQGPYGKTMEIVNVASNLDAFVFYVGGTGITAALAAIHVLLDDMNNLSPADAPAASKKIFLFWAAGVEPIDSFSLIRDWVTNVTANTAAPVVRLFDTTDPGYDKPICNETLVTRGRPHMLTLLNKHITPLFDDVKPLNLGIFICGPEGFTSDGISGANAFKHANKNVNITLEVESFCL
jgi:DMSO/TMAO reductase YedYZ heme-binding membrane subunit